MANGSTNDPFTRSQTRGIHIDGTWNTQLRDVYVVNTPSNSAAIFIDDGSPSLGCFWTRLDNVFVDAYTKLSIANGYTGPNQNSNPPQASRDATARGIVLAGNTTAVTAVTMTDVTTYRGLYMKNAEQVVGVNFHSERAPAHGVYIDGGFGYSFIGGFFEYAGNEALTGDATTYRPIYGVNTPRKLQIKNASLAGNGLLMSQWGSGLECGDPYSQSNGDRYWRIGDLHIDRNGQAYIAGATDVRIIGPYNSSTAIPVGSDTVLFGYNSGNDPLAWDANSLYSTGSGNFNVQADAVDGQPNAKIEIAYAMYLRSSSGVFAGGDYVDIKLVFNSAVHYPDGSSAGADIRNRHYLMPGAPNQLLTGVLHASITNVVNGAFNLKSNTNRANTIFGLSSSDADRGFISYRVIA